MPYIPHTDLEIAEMLKEIGVSQKEDLWKSIPENIRLKNELDLPVSLNEPAPDQNDEKTRRTKP